MAKKFNIHEWQAKQRRLYEQEDSETGNTSDETLSPLFFNHFATVASVMLSPKAGTKIFSLIFYLNTFSIISFC